MDSFSFENLKVYSESRNLVIEVYEIVRHLPVIETYALGTQLRRAIISVPSNIAEGCGRISYKEKIHFIEIAYGSLLEAYCQIEICLDLGYISQEKLKQIRQKFFNISNMLNALRKSYLSKLNS